MITFRTHLFKIQIIKLYNALFFYVVKQKTQRVKEQVRAQINDFKQKCKKIKNKKLTVEKKTADRIIFKINFESEHKKIKNLFVIM